LGHKRGSERQWLDFRYAVSKGSKERWKEVVVCLVRCDGGRGAACSKTRAGEGGLGQKCETGRQRLDFGYAGSNRGEVGLEKVAGVARTM
jgi:hypothetical protein